MEGEVIHTVAGADFNKYWYIGVYIPASQTATINGVAVGGGPIIIPVGISSASQISGAGSFLIGKKKFGETSGTTGFWENSLSNDTGNAKGSFSIK